MDDTLKGKSIQDFRHVIRDNGKFFEMYESYTGTNNNTANTFLKSVLDDQEKNCLLELLHGERGWYRDMLGEGARKLKLTAYFLGFTNNSFARTQDDHQEYVVLAENISEQEQNILISSYLKQKIVTYKTLKNHNINEINLLRGIKVLNGSNYYLLSNLEPWTDNEKVARKFATYDGYILYKKYQVEDIFVCNRSVFKTENIPSSRFRRMIKQENEYIVENKDSMLKLLIGQNIDKWADFC